MTDTLATILSDTRVLLEVGDAMAQDIDGFGVHYLRDRLIQSAALHALWVSALDRAHADDPEYAAAHIDRVLIHPNPEETQSHE